MVLTHTEVYKFSFELSYVGKSYTLGSLGGQRFLANSEGLVVALFERSWRDSDIEKMIHYSVHCSEDVNDLVLAVFFCLAARLDPMQRPQED